MIPKVSVLVPIYKVEQYIERCARSLFEQTLDEIEYVFVDDCSPDGSREILEKVIEDYPQRKPWIKIARHPQNKGIATTRNTAMSLATADYVIYCDSDDWVEPDMYETMYEKAIEVNADMVHCGYWREEPSKHIKYDYPVHETGIEMLKDPSRPWRSCSLWCKLVKKSLYTNNKIQAFPGLNMAEDLTMIIRLYFFTEKMVKIEKPLYHYDCSNTASITSSLHTRPFITDQFIENVKHIESFFTDNGKDDEFQNILDYLKLLCKSPLLLLKGCRNIDLWKRTFPESNPRILKLKGMPFRIKQIYWIAANSPKWITSSMLACYDRVIILIRKMRK